LIIYPAANKTNSKSVENTKFDTQGHHTYHLKQIIHAITCVCWVIPEM